MQPAKFPHQLFPKILFKMHANINILILIFLIFLSQDQIVILPVRTVQQ